MSGMAKNIAVYPWFRFCQGLVFWQAIWFLYFQNTLSASDAILLYAIYDIGTTALEVPSGYMSDRLGRRFTLCASAAAGFGAAMLLALGGSFEVFALGQALLGASAALASGTDSALLYESLTAAGRRAEIERQEVRAWRFSFCALALSAVAGGAIALRFPALPFLAGGAAFIAALVIALRFTEPPRAGVDFAEGAEILRFGSLQSVLTSPVLIWLFMLSILMYMFSHIPFAFGQPFILEALEGSALAGEAGLVSGLVSALMMMFSVATSLFAPKLRRRLGLPALLLLAFAMQIGLCGVLALTDSAVAIAFLFLRMVPDSLSRPFIMARIQPMLSNESRATYISLQSFCGRLLFAATLFLASLSTSGEGEMAYADIRRVLGWCILGGALCFGALVLTARRLKIDRDVET
ncbi:MFS transporter [Pikeienuella piscinae]|uniref:MFS transporter n=2 Tax=Pikeienuella piscinae TaxID=2748098 RepID=A0A7M3T722_9RHOB|nr:MFS transporter [Pikeienuella piscinae]